MPMPYSEVYAALETKSIDGAENNWPSYETMRHYEVAKYITLDAHSRIPEMQLASQATWEKLSEADREIIRPVQKSPPGMKEGCGRYVNRVTGSG